MCEVLRFLCGRTPPYADLNGGSFACTQRGVVAMALSSTVVALNGGGTHALSGVILRAGHTCLRAYVRAYVRVRVRACGRACGRAGVWAGRAGRGHQELARARRRG